MTDDIIIGKKNKPNLKEVNKVVDLSANSFRIGPKSLSMGLIAGALMGIYLLFLQVIGLESSVALKFLKYLFLFAIIGWGLNQYRKWNPTDTFFRNGIQLGAFTTFVSGLTLIVFDLLVSVVLPEFSFNKFNLTIDSPLDFLVTSVAIFFEVLVFGMVCTFIFLQYLKGNTDGDITTTKR